MNMDADEIFFFIVIQIQEVAFLPVFERTYDIFFRMISGTLVA